MEIGFRVYGFIRIVYALRVEKTKNTFKPTPVYGFATGTAYNDI